MDTLENVETLIENIFVDEQINSQQLKEFLKLISSRLNAPEEVVATEAGPPEEEDTAEFEEVAQIQYLSDLITQCEKRLANLSHTPKTRVVIRNEGEKLQSIIDSLESVKCANSCLQTQIDELSNAHKRLKSLECERRQKYQDLIDRLYQKSMNSDVCHLRRMYYGVQEQVDQLIVKVDALQKDVQALQKKIVIVDVIPEMQMNIQKLLDWRALLKEDLEHYVERYEHLKTVKAGKCEVNDWLKEKVNYCHLSKYVHKKTFEVAREEFVAEFNEIKELFCELQIFLSARLVSLHTEMKMVMAKLDSKRRLEKRS